MFLNRRMDKEDVEHYMMEYYSVVKDIMKVAGKWRQLKNITLSKVTQMQKDKYSMYIHL